MLDVGHGLAVIVRTASYVMLYDTGPAWSGGDAGDRVVTPALRSLGIRDLDNIVLSHPDNDHAGGLASVLEAFPAARVISSADVDNVARRAPTPCSAGLEWLRDGVRFRVLSESRPGLSDNDASCVVAIEAAFGTAVLPGDIESRSERLLAGRPRPRPPVLVIAPHHGSRTSSTRAFVDWSNARYVSFSAAWRSRWNLPAATIVSRWRDAGACTRNTGATGAQHWRIGYNRAIELRNAWRFAMAGSWREPPKKARACQSRTAIMAADRYRE